MSPLLGQQIWAYKIWLEDRGLVIDAENIDVDQMCKAIAAKQEETLNRVSGIENKFPKEFSGLIGEETEEVQELQGFTSQAIERSAQPLQRIQSLQQVKLLILGDYSDRQMNHEPFTKKEKQLLLRILHSMELTMADVHFAGFNTNGDVEELDALFKQIEPQFILALGQSVGAKLFGRSNFSIKTHHGSHAFIYCNRKKVKVYSTFHPKTLLVAPQFKKQVWQDLQGLIADLRLSENQ